MKKLRLKQNVKDILGIILFYIFVVIGVIAINARVADISNDDKYNNTYEVVERGE